MLNKTEVTMAWWSIQPPYGGVKWTALDSAATHKNKPGTKAVLLNKMPGRANASGLYNGDEVADIVDNLLKKLYAATLAIDHEAIEVEFISAAENSTMSADMRAQIATAREAVNRVYRREWGRLPQHDELHALWQLCASDVV